MNYPFRTFNHTLFDGSTAGTNISGLTSAPVLVSDFMQMSLSWASQTTAASLLTVWASNEDGFLSSLVTWSSITGLTGQGAYAIEPGMKWLRITRNSNDSRGQVFLNARV